MPVGTTHIGSNEGLLHEDDFEPGFESPATENLDMDQNSIQNVDELHIWDNQYDDGTIIRKNFSNNLEIEGSGLTVEHDSMVAGEFAAASSNQWGDVIQELFINTGDSNSRGQIEWMRSGARIYEAGGEIYVVSGDGTETQIT